MISLLDAEILFSSLKTKYGNSTGNGQREKRSIVNDTITRKNITISSA